MSIGNTCDTLTNAAGSIAMGPTTARKSSDTELEFQTLDLGILGILAVKGVLMNHRPSVFNLD
jgi:hypothetical protein